MRWDRTDKARLGIAMAAGLWLAWGLGWTTAASAQEVFYPVADGSLVDGGSFGPYDGAPDAADWTFNQSGYEGAITLVTAPPSDRLEHRLVWEYDLSGLTAVPPVSATLTFTLRGRAAFPIPDAKVHVYAYPADLAETLADYSSGPAVLQCSITVVAYEEDTYSVAVTDAVSNALQNGDNAVGFRFQISPSAESDADQAFIDALEDDVTTKPFLTVREAAPADADGDGVADGVDLCAGFDDRFDGDDDGVADGCDNCPDDVNPSQSDGDGDGAGDVCSDAPPPPPDDGGGDDGGGTGGGGGGGGGGGTTPPPPPPAPEPDATDESGRFVGQVTGVDGRLLAEVSISGAAPRLLVSYDLVSDQNSNGAPGPDGGSFAGFGDGAAMNRTFTVEFDGRPGSYTAEIRMHFTDDELSAAGVRADDVTLHVWDTSHAPAMWMPAGDDLGLSRPTGVLGDSGFYRGPDDSWVYWAVRDELSSFAVGAPQIDAAPDDTEPAEVDEPDEDDTPVVDDSTSDEPVATDTDGDGVVDEFDLCPRTARAALVDEDGCPIEPSQPQDVPDEVIAPSGGGSPCGLFGMISLSLMVVGLGQMKFTARPRRRTVALDSVSQWVTD